MLGLCVGLVLQTALISSSSHFHTVYKNQQDIGSEWRLSRWDSVLQCLLKEMVLQPCEFSGVRGGVHWIEYWFTITQSGALRFYIGVMIVSFSRTRTGSGLIFLPRHLVLCLAHGTIQQICCGTMYTAHSTQKDSCSPFEIKNNNCVHIFVLIISKLVTTNRDWFCNKKNKSLSLPFLLIAQHGLLCFSPAQQTKVIRQLKFLWHKEVCGVAETNSRGKY